MNHELHPSRFRPHPLIALATVGLLASCTLADDRTGAGPSVEAHSSALIATALRINCGSTSTQGAFGPDQYFDKPGSVTRANTITTTGVPNPAPVAVYQSMHHDQSRTGFKYTLPGFPIGFSNTIRLHFADTNPSSKVGFRAFNVKINDQPVLTSLDVFVAAGGLNKALVREFTMPPKSDQTYVIEFSSIQGKDAAMVSGIEVVVQTPCADGSAGQAFGGDVRGCAGRVTFGQAKTLCGAGYHVATANEWATWHQNVAPSHNYWLAESVRYAGGSSGLCLAANAVTGGVVLPSGPMHVCVSGGTDPLSNLCDQANECGLDSTGPSLHLGGARGTAAATAGALCVKDQCRNGKPTQVFNNGMVGCEGMATFAGRGSLCADGYHVASADEWVKNSGGVAPTRVYWTNDDLQFTGSVSNNCAARYLHDSPHNSPLNEPFRVCPGPNDPLGNLCTLSGCGLLSPSPTKFFGGGGVAADSRAGALCVHDVSEACPASCGAACNMTQACGVTLWDMDASSVVTVPIKVTEPRLNAAVTIAMNTWNDLLKPRIKLVTHTNESKYVTVNCITVSDDGGVRCNEVGNGGWATYGQGDGRAMAGFDVNIGAYTVGHEFGHTLGLYHEHLRMDRDRSVQVPPTYLGCSLGNWQKCDLTAITSMLGPYDLTSTMQYTGDAINAVNRNFVNKRGSSPPEPVSGMGPPTKGDAAKVLEMYATQLGWRRGATLARDVGTRVPRSVELGAGVKPQGRPAPAFPGASGRGDYFVRGSDKHIYYRSRDTSGNWGAYEDLGATFDSDPAAASWGTGTAIVVAANAGKLKWRKYVSGWAAWQSIADPFPAMAPGTSPAVVSWAPEKLHVFVRTTAGGLMFNFYNGTSWGGWTAVSPATPAGVTFTGSPTVASQGVNELNIYVAGTNGTDNAIYSTWLGAAFGWQNGWTREACCVETGTSPTATARRGGLVDLLWHEAGKHVLQWKYATNQWYGPYLIGTYLRWTDPKNASITADYTPVAVTVSPTQLEVFTLGADGGLWERPLNMDVPIPY